MLDSAKPLWEACGQLRILDTTLRLCLNILYGSNFDFLQNFVKKAICWFELYLCGMHWGQYGYQNLLELYIQIFFSKPIMTSLIKASDSGPLGFLVGCKGEARLKTSGSDKQPPSNHVIHYKSSQDRI